ncbi:hypothetical protein [Streptomyces halobius]|uniref:Uncharacterized protein n=1 Tax=Streptomyces halobius TaxID=2879846 RepID=A0ABY4M2E5_9ACTN|nr:hypothetical protein [Streptomyces halobius]UQA91627.1 hypothetical protein K9S39_06930 [Streptomyces halobius]
MAGSIVTRLPFPFSGRTVAGAATYALKDVRYDVAIGGIPFLTAISDERPMTRELAQTQREQFDNSRNPGEQSLADWWLRSQSTFVGGAGLLYQDPDVSNEFAIRFGESVGVNPWVNGSLTMLRSTAVDIADATVNPHFVLGWDNAGTDSYWSGVATTLKSSDGTTITWGGVETIRSLASDGTNYYVADLNNVYKGAGTGNGAAWTATGTTNALVRWVKGRIMIALDHQVYEADAAGVKTLRFTHLNSAWTWTDFAEGTNAIYASGFAGSQSSIYKFELDATGDVPTLTTGGVLTAQLPHGEVVHSLLGYLGTFVGIGTNRGFRVGQIDDNGDIAYGPLLFATEGPVRSIAAFDRFFFVAAENSIDGSSGLYRVDLGQPIQTGDVTPGIRFAYATDLQSGVSGEVDSVTNFGNSDRMVFTVRASGSYLESAGELETSGTFTTGRVRYNTLIKKIFKFLSVKTPDDLAGSLTASIIDPGGGETSVITISQGGSAQIENVLLQSPATAVEWIQLKLTFNRSTVDTATGPEVNGWQFKALPGEVKQRIFTIPLACFDKEKDVHGQLVGFEGRTRARLEGFEELAQAGDAVQFQDLYNGLSYLVLIDEYQFEQKANPGLNGTNYGGYLYVKLRTIADVITA